MQIQFYSITWKHARNDSLGYRYMQWDCWMEPSASLLGKGRSRAKAIEMKRETEQKKKRKSRKIHHFTKYAVLYVCMCVSICLVCMYDTYTLQHLWSKPYAASFIWLFGIFPPPHLLFRFIHIFFAFFFFNAFTPFMQHTNTFSVRIIVNVRMFVLVQSFSVYIFFIIIIQT